MSGIAWTESNVLRLLENGEEFFPRVFETIGEAGSEVLIDTFILKEDEVGRQLGELLCAAARRGVRVALTLDGYGTPELSEGFVRELTGCGVVLRWFDLRPRRMGFRTNLFRRLHRKLVLVDGETAFIGGINFSAEHLRSWGPLSKQDYAIEVRGPVAQQVRSLMADVDGPPLRASALRRWWLGPRNPAAPAAEFGPARAGLVVRDDQAHRQDIERAYRLGIRGARWEIIIANAYFFPGYRLLRELRRAARRGVAVHLVLQGRTDMRLVRLASSTLYDSLLRSGVHIHEYGERPLHAKVAVIDRRWATVGSSNLDPLSLFLNLEANLVAEDRVFADNLRSSLRKLMREQCKELQVPAAGPTTPLRNLSGFLAFHLLRRLPGIAGWVPAHADSHVLLHDAAGNSDMQGSSVSEPRVPTRVPSDPRPDGVVRDDHYSRSSVFGSCGCTGSPSSALRQSTVPKPVPPSRV
ncbi:MAG TPA: cardiolipin synthase ClsB [Nevskia sp.]|nr:cardiolipin synthase ClsB [Nevskia sp.]